MLESAKCDQFRLKLQMGFTTIETHTGSSGMAKDHSTEDLPERIRRGERLAESELVNRFYGSVFAMAVVRTRDPETARDVAQDVLFSVLCALREDRLHDASALAGYVYATARNRINYHFRQETHRAGENPDPLRDVDLPDPEQSAQETERRRLAMDAISRLGKSEQEILRLTLVEGLKPGEIATRLGLKPEVVRKRKSRAVHRVRQILTWKRSRN
jgi:RNA polymerase sigma-70 factor (ECF subfamily)